MPSDHNHAKRLEKKKRQRTKWEEGHAKKHVKFSDESKKDSANSVPKKEEKHPSKLQHTSSVCQLLVTHCSMTPTKADKVFNEAFNRAMDLF